MLVLGRNDQILDLAQLVGNPVLTFTSVRVVGVRKDLSVLFQTTEGNMKLTTHASGNLARFRDSELILWCLTAYPSLSRLVVVKLPSC